MAAATLGYAWWSTPFDIEYSEIAMPLRGLTSSFEGFRIVQVTDLHTGRSTPVSFLRKIVQRVNQMDCDLVCITGDLVSGRMKWVAPACDILAELRKPTVVTFGNHDYAEHKEPWESSEIADALQARLESGGITVLRNRAIPLERDGSRIWIVGLEDFWSMKFSPHEAFAATNPDEPIIALSHNPDSVFALEHFGAQWILAGHTHGGQIRIPIAGPIVLPVRHKQFDQGLFRVGNSFLYVCRGVGFRLQVRFRCRPEVASFVLQRHR